MIGGGVGGGIQSSLNGGSGFQIVLGALMGAQQGYAVGSSVGGFAQGFAGAGGGLEGDGLPGGNATIVDASQNKAINEVIGTQSVSEFASAAPSKTGAILSGIFGSTLAYASESSQAASRQRPDFSTSDAFLAGGASLGYAATQFQYNQAQQIAKEVGSRRFGHNDAGDAVRHAEWSMKTALETNQMTAQLAGLGHEIEAFFRETRLMPVSQYFREARMDLYNNKIGRQAANSGGGINMTDLMTRPDDKNRSY